MSQELLAAGGTIAQASFTKESLGKSIVKIFKRELQTGDAFFDDMVYIATNNKETTEKFLEEDAVRDYITDVISQGGSIILEETKIQLSIVGELSASERDKMAQFIAYAGNL